MVDLQNFIGRSIKIHAVFNGYPELTLFFHCASGLKIEKTRSPSDFGQDPSLTGFGNVFNSTAGVEGPHRKLRSRFTNRLGGDDTDCLTHIDKIIRCEIVAIALGTDSFVGLASQHGTDVHHFYAKLINLASHLFRYQNIGRNKHVTRLRMEDIFTSNASVNFKGKLSTSSRKFLDAVKCPAIFEGNANILCNIHQLPGQVTRSSGFHCRVHQSLTRPISRVKIVNNIQTFTIGTEIVRQLVPLPISRCSYRWNEDIAILFCLQSDKGTDLHKWIFSRTSTAISHDMDWTEAFYRFIAYL